jgi:uncharacterized tellurite resistance protein B-like protein
MFNLFNKKEANSISEVFNELTTNQKMSINNLLTTIAVCDGKEGDLNKEMQYLNTYIGILGVRNNRCIAYLKSEGPQKMINDLKSISQKQKEVLVIAAWELIICDGRPNETESQVTIRLFEQIGISEEQFMATIKKTQTIYNETIYNEKEQLNISKVPKSQISEADKEFLKAMNRGGKSVLGWIIAIVLITHLTHGCYIKSGQKRASYPHFTPKSANYW